MSIYSSLDDLLLLYRNQLNLERDKMVLVTNWTLLESEFRIKEVSQEINFRGSRQKIRPVYGRIRRSYGENTDSCID